MLEGVNTQAIYHATQTKTRAEEVLASLGCVLNDGYSGDNTADSNNAATAAAGSGNGDGGDGGGARGPRQTAEAEYRAVRTEATWVLACAHVATVAECASALAKKKKVCGLWYEIFFSKYMCNGENE